MALKHFKSNEVKLQEQLYENIFLLTQEYETSEEFKCHFKRDMFLKNNKAGFYQVVYYLLNILNPELTKQKLTSWPPYEVRLESKFRSELIQYISELNSVYESANIPVLMTSHLISPGGVKFLKFMLKLSELVLVEHLKKTENLKLTLIYNLNGVRSNAVANAYIKNMKAVTDDIEHETKNIYDDFMGSFAKMKAKAEKIVEKKSQINLALAEISVEYKKMQVECDELYSSPPLIEINEKIDYLKLKLHDIISLKTRFEELENLVSFLCDEKNILRLKGEVPEEVSHIINSNDKFDLLMFLQAVQLFLERISLQMPHLPAAYFVELKAKVDNMCAKYTDSLRHAERLHDDLIQMLNKNFQNSNNFKTQDEDRKHHVGIVFHIDKCDMYDLAEPLDVSPEPLIGQST